MYSWVLLCIWVGTDTTGPLRATIMWIQPLMELSLTPLIWDLRHCCCWPLVSQKVRFCDITAVLFVGKEAVTEYLPASSSFSHSETVLSESLLITNHQDSSSDMGKQSAASLPRWPHPHKDTLWNEAWQISNKEKFRFRETTGNTGEYSYSLFLPFWHPFQSLGPL